MELQARFTRPAAWRSGDFVNLATNHKIHYGTINPDGEPRGVCVILPGLSEFTEKYHELARDLLSRGFAVWVLDWAYQGRSTRMDKTPMRRHSDGFGADIADLHKLIGDHVLPASQGRKLVMIGHSMGGHIGLRYLAEHAGIFNAAAFSAPMLGIATASKIPLLLQNFLLQLLPRIDARYFPGGADWHEALRKSDGTDLFSSDPARDALHQYWSRANPELQIGGVTNRWVVEAVQSCRALMPRLAKISTPVLLSLAQRDKIVDNAAIRHAAAVMPHATLIELDGALHEILMERDAIRGQWLEAFDKLLASADI